MGLFIQEVVVAFRRPVKRGFTSAASLDRDILVPNAALHNTINELLRCNSMDFDQSNWIHGLVLRGKENTPRASSQWLEGR